MKCIKCGIEIPDDSVSCPNCGQSTTDINHKEKGQTKNMFLKAILIVIAIGIWMLVFQNLGVIPVTQNVIVKNTVDVSGYVGIGNTVDVNLEEINGHSNVFFNNPGRGEKDKYYVLPVTVE